MKNNKTDNFNLYDNRSIDSSRTTDSVSNSYSIDINPLKNDIDIEIEKRNDFDYLYEDSLLKKSQMNHNKITLDNKEEKPLKNTNAHFFEFKKKLSVILCTIYLVLFLIYLPKHLVPVGERQNLHILLEKNITNDMHILINDFNFFFSTNKSTSYNQNYEPSGYLLEKKTDTIYIIKWLIGFIYFIVKNIGLIYSSNNEENKNSNHIFKNKIDMLQKLSCLIFPLYLYYYDIHKNTFFISEIKKDYINSKIIYYYIKILRNNSMIDHVEGIIPTLFYFILISVYDGMEKTIFSYFRIKSKNAKKN